MKITTDGNHKLNTNLSGIASGTYVIYVSGVPAGAILTLTYKDPEGDYIPLLNGGLVVGEQYTVSSGLHMPIYASVSGATGSTDINIITKGKV